MQEGGVLSGSALEVSLEKSKQLEDEYKRVKAALRQKERKEPLNSFKLSPWQFAEMSNG